MSRQIGECIDDSYEKHITHLQSSSFTFKENGGSRISCAFDDIQFFETEPGNSKLIVLHAKKRSYKFYGTINDIVKELPTGQFFRCHKSYIINMAHLTDESVSGLRHGKGTVMMPNGEACYVSARRKSGLIRLMDR
jgi:DNA-binding LytR/AlgR family response regulator